MPSKKMLKAKIRNLKLEKAVLETWVEFLVGQRKQCEERLRKTMEQAKPGETIRTEQRGCGPISVEIKAKQGKGLFDHLCRDIKKPGNNEEA